MYLLSLEILQIFRNLGYHPLGPIRTNNCINSQHYLYTNPWATLKKKKEKGLTPSHHQILI
ncbi:hypothetical protein HI914_05342 [Erysiphe necator]|nr:hypothetical protein HI914_05342 [Erysiphe necator]